MPYPKEEKKTKFFFLSWCVLKLHGWSMMMMMMMMMMRILMSSVLTYVCRERKRERERPRDQTNMKRKKEETNVKWGELGWEGRTAEGKDVAKQSEERGKVLFFYRPTKKENTNNTIKQIEKR